MKKLTFFFVVFTLLFCVQPTMATLFMGEFSFTVTSGDIAPVGNVYYGNFTYDDSYFIYSTPYELTPLLSLNFEFDGFTFPLDIPSKLGDLPRLQAAYVEFEGDKFVGIDYGLGNNPIAPGEYNCVDWAGIVLQYSVWDNIYPNKYSLIRRAAGRLNYTTPVEIPEPLTLLLLGSGLIGLVLFGRRRFRK